MTINRKLALFLSTSLLMGAAPALATHYTIATVSPLSGSQAPLGTELKRGTELAFQMYGEELKRLGIDVSLKFFDDQASADKGMLVAKDILADKSIIGVVGAINSSVSNVLGLAFAGEKLAFISSSSTNDKLTKHGWTNFTRTVAPDQAQALATAQFMQGQVNGKGVYVVSDNTAYGNGLSKQVLASLAAYKVPVIKYIGIRPDAAPLASQIKASGAAFVYFAGSDDKAAPLVKALRAIKSDVKFMGGDGFDTPSFLTRMNGAGSGVMFTTVYGPPNSFSNASDYVQAYRKAYGNQQPNGVSLFSYDAAVVLIEALKKTDAAHKSVSRAAFSAAVRNVSLPACFSADKTDCKTITGALAFSPTGERVNSRVLVMAYNSTYIPEIVKIVTVQASSLK